MFVQLSVCIVSFLAVLENSGAETNCTKWMTHHNFEILNRGYCGVLNIDGETSSRILNGRTVRRGKVPWIAHIHTREVGSSSKSGGLCGGTLFNNRYILTAAHCLYGKKNPEITVVLGLENRYQLEDGITETHSVSDYIIHPNFDRPTLLNDIALIRLSKVIATVTNYINWICLPLTCELADKHFLQETLTTAGWGLTAPDQKPSILQEVELKVKACNSSHYEKQRTRICAGNSHKLTCRGDSGGPLMYKTTNATKPEGLERFYLVGVTSQSSDRYCTNKSHRNPEAVFTKVGPYINWIMNTIRD